MVQVTFATTVKIGKFSNAEIGTFHLGTSEFAMDTPGTVNVMLCSLRGLCFV